MIICGIDSSTKVTALSYFVDGELSEYFCIDLHKVKDSGERINRMICEMFDLLDLKKPDVIYYESTWVSQNKLTAIQLTKILGAITGWALANKIKLNEIKPSSWRQMLKINSKQKRDKLKECSVRLVKDRYGIDVNDDIADCVCIGLAGVITEEKNNDEIG